MFISDSNDLHISISPVTEMYNKPLYRSQPDLGLVQRPRTSSRTLWTGAHVDGVIDQKQVSAQRHQNGYDTMDMYHSLQRPLHHSQSRIPLSAIFSTPTSPLKSILIGPCPPN